MQTSDYLTSLQNDKQNLATKLTEKGVEVTGNETFTELVPKLDEIQGGGDASEYFTESIKNGNVSYGGWVESVKKLPKLNFSGTNAEDMFRYCYAEEIDLSGLDTSNVTSMKEMFFGCANVKNLNLGNFDTSKVTNMSYMFRGCRSLANLDLSSFDTSKVTDMSYMITMCNALTNLNTSGFNTSNVTSMFSMISGNINITNIDLSSFDTSKVTNMSYMFDGDKKLTSLNISNFDMEKVQTVSNIFNNCTLLENLQFGYNLGKGYVSKYNNVSNYSLNLYVTILNHDSLISAINGLYDLNLTFDVANGGTLYTQQLQIGTTNKAKLTAEEIALATAKGWTVS